MRNLFFFIALVAIFTSCNNSRSGHRNNKDQVEAPIADTATSVVDNPATLLEPDPKDYAFWVKKIEVKPIKTDENGTYGEGGMRPARTLNYEIYFMDSLGHEKQFIASDYIPKDLKSGDENEPWYKESVENFNRLKELYTKITGAPEGRLYIEGDNQRVERIFLKIDIKEIKVGNATVRQNDLIKIWPM